MKEELAVKNTEQPIIINRIAYAMFVVLAVYLWVTGDFSWAIANFGIALVFDPFDPKVSWTKRPLYQKIWLIVHAMLSIGGFIYLLIK
ncbi:MAG: hypothetical protein LT105_12140 [Lentimicrobium sp.]|jgi:hypothetical protein|nr:hypothetical protein [Lentimicrobium sp.]